MENQPDWTSEVGVAAAVVLFAKGLWRRVPHLAFIVFGHIVGFAIMARMLPDVGWGHARIGVQECLFSLGMPMLGWWLMLYGSGPLTGWRPPKVAMAAGAALSMLALLWVFSCYAAPTMRVWPSVASEQRAAEALETAIAQMMVVSGSCGSFVSVGLAGWLAQVGLGGVLRGAKVAWGMVARVLSKSPAAAKSFFLAVGEPTAEDWSRMERRRLGKAAKAAPRSRSGPPRI